MADYSTLDEGRIEQISRLSGLALSSVEPLDGGMANSSFLADTPTGRIVVTVLDNHDEASALRLARLMLHLARQGVRTPRVLGHIGVDGILELDGKPVLLKEYARGHHLDPVPTGALPDVGRLLARIHRVPPVDLLGTGGRRLPSSWQEQLGPHAPDELVELLGRVDALSASFAGLPVGVIHGDLFTDNLLVDDDGRFTILDWETATIEPFVLDIGMTAVAMCRTDDRLDDDRLGRLVDGYQSARALTESELQVIPAAIEYANGVLCFHRFLRHNVRYPDRAKADLYVELVDFGSSLAEM